MRDKLIELLKKFEIKVFAKSNPRVIEMLADHLLANGVFVPQVWIGSTVYYIHDLLGETCSKEMRVVECVFDQQGLRSLRADTSDRRMSLPFSRNHPYYSLNTLRFTKEEAEQALAERQRK